MTQLLDEILCPKCQRKCTVVMRPEQGKTYQCNCGWTSPRKPTFHITPEAALMEMLQKMFWPKD